MATKVRVIHYINQFFGQMGGEEKADIAPFLKEGPVGPGLLLKNLLGEKGEVVATIVCGDNYFANNIENAKKEVLNLLTSLKPDLLFAGPAFNAGRYGIACSEVCKLAKGKLGINAVTGMYRENPGVDLCRKEIYIIEIGASSRSMNEAMAKMVRLGLKLVLHEPIGGPQEEGYLPRGIKRNVISKDFGSERAIRGLLAKIKGEPFTTEIKQPLFDQVSSAPPIEDLTNSTIALVTEGGLVPKGNPDHIESARATRYGIYSLEGLDGFDRERFEAIHMGYDTTFVNEDPDRLVPLDVMREMEQEGVIGRVHPYFYTTTGCATSIENGRKIGNDIAKILKESEVTGVIVTST
jgi:glycine reductase